MPTWTCDTYVSAMQALVITDPSIVSEVLVQNNLQKSSGEYESLTEVLNNTSFMHIDCARACQLVL